VLLDSNHRFTSGIAFEYSRSIRSIGIISRVETKVAKPQERYIICKNCALARSYELVEEPFFDGHQSIL
jgi:hypothetical protein